MAMTTRCPRCGTAFKVVADQLRVRNGLVRCGVCSNVFDGFAAIVGGQHAAAAPAPQVPLHVPSHGVPPAQPVASQVPPQAASHGVAPAPWQPAPPAASQIPPLNPQGPVPAPSRPGWREAQQDAPYPASHASSQQPWESPVRHEQPEPRGYRDAADAPPVQSLPSPIDTESLRPRQHPPFIPDPNTQHPPFSSEPDRRHSPFGSEPNPQHATSGSDPSTRPGAFVPDQGARPAPHAPYIPQAHQAQPLPPAPERQGQGPYAVRMPEPPAQAPEPAVLRSRGDARGVDVPRGRYPDDAADADEDIDPREDIHIFVSDADRERHEYDRSAERRAPIFADPDARGDDYAVVSIPGEARTRYDDSVDAGMAPPQFMDEGVQRRNVLIRRLWACGCLLGLIVLALQWIFVYRTAIVAAVPALRPAFQSVCAPLGCEIGYARRIERISILSSSLQPPANASSAAVEGAPTRLVLAVTMRNRYDKPQPWPALVLQLTDLSDTVVVRKVLRPQDYLPAGAPAAFEAGGEQVLAVPIQVAGVQVNGYQLDKFFP